MQELTSHIFFIGTGLVVTLTLLVSSLFLGLFLGVLLSILRYAGIGCGLINRIISILRGTPITLQLSFVYFTTPSLIGIKLSILSAGILTFGLNSAVYIAEIIRAGIQSLPKGQFEAAKTLEIPCFYMWKDIILPQVFRNVLPGIINEVIALLKDTALITTIGGMDIMRTAQTLASAQFTYFVPLCIAGGYYYCLVLLIESFGRRIEKRGAHAQIA